MVKSNFRFDCDIFQELNQIKSFFITFEQNLIDPSHRNIGLQKHHNLNVYIHRGMYINIYV